MPLVAVVRATYLLHPVGLGHSLLNAVALKRGTGSQERKDSTKANPRARKRAASAERRGERPSAAPKKARRSRKEPVLTWHDCHDGMSRNARSEKVCRGVFKRIGKQSNSQGQPADGLGLGAARRGCDADDVRPFFQMCEFPLQRSILVPV